MMKRRSFLNQPFAEAVSALLRPDGATRPFAAARPVTPNSDQALAFLRFARQAMATTFEVVLPFGSPHDFADIEQALDEIERVETQLTVYRPHSEVSRLNERAGRGPCVATPSLLALLQECVRISNETDGAFDVTSGALTKAWGFFRRQGRLPSVDELQNALANTGWRHLRLDPQRLTAKFDRLDLLLNFGSIGKGYALDLAAAQLRPNHANFLVHGGHSSLLARGAEVPNADAWSVGLTDPDQPNRRLAVVHLRNRALGVSAITWQHFVHDGVRRGHILDPRTGEPATASHLAAATAPSAALADALATAFFVGGVEFTRKYCESRPEIGAVLLPADGPRVLRLVGRAAQEVELL